MLAGNLRIGLGIAIALNLLAAASASPALANRLVETPATGSGVLATTFGGRTGQSFTVAGTTVTLQQLRARQEPPKGNPPHEASPRRATSLATRPASTPTSGSSPQVSSTPHSPQVLADEILGPKITDLVSGAVPPDTMGAVGPTQYLFSVNGRFRAFNKNSPHTQILDFDQATFWGSKAVGGVSDAHVRYDRTSQRWFMIEIDVTSSANHILLAVSSTSDLSSATWTQFQIPATGGTALTDMGCFDDYPTPGIDQNGIYIGGNMFGGNVVSCPGLNYLHSNLYVIQKSSALTSTVHVTGFFNVVSGLFAVETIQGVDSVDSMTTGFAIASKETESPVAHLSLWQINNPGTTTPSLSGPTDVAITSENGVLGGGGVGVVSKNNAVSANPTRGMDDLDDRLFAATIRAGHLWTAHNVAVDSSGNSNGGTRTRDAARWYDVTVAGPTLNQSGTVFDSAASGFLQYWMPTVMVSGQGHAAMGLNRANASTVVQAGALGRLAGDAAGTMGGFSVFQASTSDAYDDAGFNPGSTNRWGDFTYTSLDPCDDMTMWTAQEYVAGSSFGVDWGVAAEKLLAPGPATPSSASPNAIFTGQSNVNVAVTGTSAGGSGFYDTPSTITDPCRKRITASVSGGVTVNSVTYTDPTHLTLNLSTVGATPGTQNLTVTNPDGQSVVASNFLTINGPYVAGVVGTDNGLWALHSGSPTFTSDGGVLIGAPAVVAIPQTSGPALPIYIATGSDHALYVRSDTKAWQSLSPAPTNCLDNPAAVVIALTLYVACQGSDNALWHAETAAPTGTNLPAVISPSSWQSLGGTLIAGPAVGSVGGTPTYLAIGTDQHVYLRTLTTGFTRFSWACIGHPALASFGSTSYFGCHGLDNALWYATNTGGVWSPAQSMGGVLADGVGIAATSTGPIFFVEGTGGGVYHTSISSGFMSDGGQVMFGAGATAL